MRTFWRVVGGFFLGLIVTYLVVVAGMFLYAHLNHIVDRDGGMSMGIVFVIGPFSGILGGIICAIVFPLLLGRRDRARAAGQLPPATRWPRALRMMIAAIVAALAVYWIAWALLWIRGPLVFDTYWTAYAVGSLPRVLGLFAAAIAAWIVYRRDQPAQ